MNKSTVLQSRISLATVNQFIYFQSIYFGYKVEDQIIIDAPSPHITSNNTMYKTSKCIILTISPCTDVSYIAMH